MTTWSALVTRKQLTPLEEAKAVQAMLDEGYTLDGAAQALGWSRQLVTARSKILTLPEVGQALVGSGEIPVSAIDTLLAIADVSPQLAEALVASIAAGKRRRIAARQQRRTIGHALRDAGKDTFGAYLNTIHRGDLKSLRLGKKTDALVAVAEKLHKQVAAGPGEQQAPRLRGAALERATKSVLPASHVRLQRALAAAARTYSARSASSRRARGARSARLRRPTTAISTRASSPRISVTDGRSRRSRARGRHARINHTWRNR